MQELPSGKKQRHCIFTIKKYLDFLKFHYEGTNGAYSPLY